VGHQRIRTEQAGAKKRTGASVARLRLAKGSRSLNDWGGLDRFSAHASRGVLRHMTEDEDAAGLSWDKLRPK
jgi:hypothetical protein